MTDSDFTPEKGHAVWLGESVYNTVVAPKRLRSMYSQIPPGTELLDIMINYKRAMYHHLSYIYPFVRRVAESLEPPITVVETGVQEGVSSAFALEALHDAGVEGSLWSIDLPNAVYPVPEQGTLANDTMPVGVPTGAMVQPDMRAGWHLIIGDARVVLPDVLRRAGPIALFHHDSLHTSDHMQFEFDHAWDALRPGGILASDDALWNRVLGDFGLARGTTVRFAQNPRHPGAGGVTQKVSP